MNVTGVQTFALPISVANRKKRAGAFNSVTGPCHLITKIERLLFSISPRDTQASHEPARRLLRLVRLQYSDTGFIDLAGRYSRDSDASAAVFTPALHVGSGEPAEVLGQ